MANIAHSILTGADLHEPKGVAAASTGQVYVANGSGSGSWSDIGTSSFTGLIADFPWPVVQTGWLECDGSDISIFTYSSLYAVMTIQTSGTRTNGSAIITSLSSTVNLRGGYYVFGSGFPSGTQIVTIDSPTQITVSNASSSSGTSSVSVSPWFLNTGTIRLPDLSTAGRFRRSRSNSTAVGQLQADQNQAHIHNTSGSTSGESVDHSHTYSATSSTESAQHTHPLGAAQSAFLVAVNNGGGASQGNLVNTSASVSAGLTTGVESTTHTHSISGTTSGVNADHSHNININSTSSGGAEARPVAIVMMTCVKT